MQSTVFNGQRLIIPGTYVDQQVVDNAVQAPTTGVITIVGEASTGRKWSELADVSDSSYTPDQLALAIAEFGSGPLVDAFRAAINSNSDPAINGAANLVYLVKTNGGTKAASLVLRSGITTPASYGSLQAKLAGLPGNLISIQNLTNRVTILPAVTQFGVFAKPTGNWTLGLNATGAGGSVITGSFAAAPATLVSAITSSYTDSLYAQGGEDRGVLSSPSQTGTISAAVTGGSLVVSTSVVWNNTPVAGDVAQIGSASNLAGAAAANVGSYRIASVTSTALTLVPVNTTGSLIAVSAISRAQNDIDAWSPVSIFSYGGDARAVLSNAALSSTSFTSVITGTSSKISLPSGTVFPAPPRVNDYLQVNTAVAGLAVGVYQVTAVTNQGTGSFNVTRLSSGSAGTSGAANGSVWATDAQIITSDASGIGQTLELFIPAASASADANVFKNTASATVGSATHASIGVLTLATQERRTATIVSKPSQLSAQTETWLAGGDVVLELGYGAGEAGTAAVTIDDTDLSFTGTSFTDTISLAAYPTLTTLVAYLNTIPGFTARVTDPRWSGLSPVQLDNGTFDIAGVAQSSRPGRIKKDGQAWFDAVSQSSLVEVPSFSLTGLPDADPAATFLSGGLRGATLASDVTDAIDACELLDTNFLITAFDRDAAADITDGLTDSGSTYDIAGLNAYAKDHVISMSSIKGGKNRIALVAYRASSILDAQNASRTLNHPRVVLSWFRIRDSISGQTVILPAWAVSAKVGGMSCAADYRGIVKKFVNISGLVYPAGFDVRRNGDKEDALSAGLTLIESVNTGGFRFTSDQTTYSTDNNFVYNSIQAVYLADLLTLQLIQNSNRIIVGQPLSIVTKSFVRGFLDTEMRNALARRLTAPSDDAPLGYKIGAIAINGPVVEIALVAKLGTLVYFVPISLSIEAVQSNG